MLIQILVDNPTSWIIPYAEELKQQIEKEFGYDVVFINEHKDVKRGDVLCLLSCEKIFKHLSYNNYNLVVHESDLPKGKGWSPVSWQVLEGVSRIPVTLFEAAEKVDSGRIYGKQYMELEGHELLTEIKHQQGIKTQELILEFLRNFPVEGKEQEGEESFYPRRTNKDSELDINQTIKDQFNLLRICDNERYPAFFNYNGQKYFLKIYKEDE
ncbi:hypothetical protein [Winogradskyella sp.]|jgi:methionyl-tRNA formyltransferase|uniref:hypothetical protein n=1 Tax=Winogradskyella sp. TaxID=1883156 RepID=UPI0025E258F8|nr:hypothetical protein [Winogradskyella sp.]MCT4628554.1 hypothetical protein [Winogradskyella sp.]